MSFDIPARFIAIGLMGALPLTIHAADVPKSSGANADASSLARGKYLVTIAGCNDCHTAGYAMTNGKIPEKDWLAGDRLGSPCRANAAACSAAGCSSTACPRSFSL